MHRDRYGNALGTASAAAAEAYRRGVDLMLAAQPGADGALAEAVAEDPAFAAAHLAAARLAQGMGRGRDIAAPLARARQHAAGATAQEQARIAALGLLLEGKGAAALAAIRAHLADHPRDVMAAQPCMGVFGLIGFSGQPGREAEMLAFTTALAPHYGEDWWFLSAHAFAEMEAGRTGPAAATIERSLELCPRNANGAHYKAHLHYECGETAAGLAWLEDWRRDYAREGQLHCHIAWHVALWSLAAGDAARMWRVVDADVAPGAAWGPPLNVLTDMAAILCRAELAGVPVPAARWQGVSDHAAACFPEPGLAFADVHAALAHAMAGNGAALARIVAGAKGPAGDVVRALAGGFGALAAGRWAEAAALLAPAMADHARIGGSRAQRDLIEHAMLACLLRLGQTDEARRMVAMRRPVSTPPGTVAGFTG